MLGLYLALIGLVVGFLLDGLIVRLATAPLGEGDDALGAEPQDEAPDEPEGENPPSPERAPPLESAGAYGAETGSLVVGGDGSGRGWARTLLIVAATAGLFGAAGARFDDVSHLALVAAYICVLVVCASTDLLSFRVPNVITYPAIVGALFVGAAMPGADLPEVLAGGALAGGVLLLPSLVTGGAGMGLGDVKLAAFVGLALGFANLPAALLFMALSGGAVALALLVTGVRKRGEPIPYAPFISAGALAALLWQGTAFISLT